MKVILFPNLPPKTFPKPLTLFSQGGRRSGFGVRARDYTVFPRKHQPTNIFQEQLVAPRGINESF